VWDGTALPPSMTYDFSKSLKGTFARTVVGGVKGTPAKLKPAGNALADNASQARAQNILGTHGRGFLDARVTCLRQPELEKVQRWALTARTGRG
jgi:hypothetical protein